MQNVTKKYRQQAVKSRQKSVSGVISQSGMKINGENGTVSLLSDIIEVSTDGDVKTQIGNVNGQFVFNIYGQQRQFGCEYYGQGQYEF